MKKIIHRSDTRGMADHDWLLTRYSFSFAEYYNPQKMGFGALRVLNDDIIGPGKGFDFHPHKNMEIITILLSGSLKHQDNLKNTYVISKGETQTMSAGTGILHSEYNNSKKEKVNLLQIWILPKALDISPTYGQKSFQPIQRKNKFQIIVSPDGREGSLPLNQDAFLILADLDPHKNLTYKIQKKGNGLYIFLISGEIAILDETLSPRDAIGLADLLEVSFESKSPTEVLIIEVPMPPSGP
jgi:redox-sensitive bicupin YhaK (pirin superfamily)